ncbi:hypothetical protein WOLCODRAFT_16967 [Wolfiporia cocos MD-104 SS10]|uniref:Uncharacterized protein n=1 Tax=Wolfiporia cocos (strain MD-104) TaxID=742152 RepID=A0A2H3JI36_WOLCO|nr:hypothetical protein WOLCODRAFT_16967 [Wolfiporia cocos MD-104 SS10]
MDYSPIAQTSLPTPPHSPRAQEPPHGAVVLLDSLTAFYQQERYWIHHTRASLEVALAKGSDSRAIAYLPASSPAESASSSSAPSPQSDTMSAASPASTSTPPADDAISLATIVKTEPDTVPSEQASVALKRSTRWNRRKNAMKLKLDGIAPHSSSRRRRPLRAPPSEPGARLLEMFSELVDARMESCQRVSRLVRDARAHRMDLCLAMC